MKLCAKNPRRGAVALETAVTLSILIFLLCMIVVGGMGVLRYHQVDCLSRIAARHVAVRGSDWAKETGQASPTTQQVLDNVVKPVAAGMEFSKVSLQIEWLDVLNGSTENWDSASRRPTTLTSSGDPVANMVRVTVTYQWTPPMLWGALTFRSVTLLPAAF